jgi:NADH dehydrogenase
MAWRIVIAGGGFGGLYAVRTLERVLPAQSARITLVNDTNFMTYAPLLPGAGAGSLEPRHVVVPLRGELGHADLRLGRVLRGNPDEQRIHVRTLEGHEETLHYDHLLVALGSVSRTLPVPGLREHGIGFKTLAEAIGLRNHVIRTLEMAETLEDPARRAEYLSYVFVGGGYAGVEGLAELQDFAAAAIERYPRCRTQGMRWILVEARDRIMGETPPDLSAFTQRELRGRGIDIRLNTTLDEVTASTVRLSDGDTIPTRTCCWTAGVKPHPVVAELGLPLDRGGRIQVDSYLQVDGYPHVWAIGDAAAVPDPAKDFKAPTPPTAQHAIRQGKLAAKNIAASIAGGRRRPFRYKTKGVVVDLGRRKAVADTMGIKWSGTIAWLIARTYHLAMMPGGNGRRMRLLVDWNIELLFGRDFSELGQIGGRTSLTDELEDHSAGGTGEGGSPEQSDRDGALH